MLNTCKHSWCCCFISMTCSTGSQCRRSAPLEVRLHADKHCMTTHRSRSASRRPVAERPILRALVVCRSLLPIARSAASSHNRAFRAANSKSRAALPADASCFQRRNEIWRRLRTVHATSVRQHEKMCCRTLPCNRVAPVSTAFQRATLVVCLLAARSCVIRCSCSSSNVRSASARYSMSSASNPSLLASTPEIDVRVALSRHSSNSSTAACLSAWLTCRSMRNAFWLNH
mmetsp:Transcript_16956/g.38039  ORF Transcript_16956/g.38039 Transcript_16956/m.38039 type:complete len:230 (-) Transcript_16956:1099-1788(-)